MKKGIITTALATAFLALTTNASAAVLQQIQIANMLYNQDATSNNPGMTTDAVLVKFFTSGSQTPCYTTTLAYQSDISVTTGTGQSCTAAVATVSFAPVASTSVGTLYTAPANITLNSDYTQQILIQQTAATVSGNTTTSHGPVFDATNGLVTTPGTVTVNVQSHLAK